MIKAEQLDKEHTQFRPVNTSERTVSNQVYTAIRNSIVTLEIEPGTAMSEKEVADRLSVSRTPVRETFIRLNREGLVNIFPQKGTYVSRISIERAKEERFLRESLEHSVLEIFMQERNPAALAKLKQMIERQQEALEQQDFLNFMTYDDQFHAVFYEATGKMLCSNIICNYSIDYYRLRFLSLLISGGIASLNAGQHIQLYELIVENNADGAQDLLTKHLRKLFKELEPMMEKYPQYFVEANADTNGTK